MASLPKIGANDLHTAIRQLADAIAGRHAATPSLVLLGIANGGIVLARRLAEALNAPTRDDRRSFAEPVRCGVIDISFHRDDIGRHPIPKEFTPTLIPIDVNGATVILVDDVLFTGRTVKAALDELFDHGRPARVELAILVDRGGRRLPVAADYTGLTLAAPADGKVVVVLDAQHPDRDRVAVAAAKSARENPAVEIS